MKIPGNSTGSFAPRVDFLEKDPKSPSFIKNKPDYTNTVWPVENGGHGGKTRKDGFTNLAFIGNDPVTEATDTPSKWLELGSGYAGITSLCTVEQTNPYGTIISLIVDNFNVHQIFIGTDADLSFRCGNKNQGWIFNWRSVMTMTEPMILVENVHYGKDFPKNPKIGQIYWTPEVMENV
jgi:hypothetical protein